MKGKQANFVLVAVALVSIFGFIVFTKSTYATAGLAAETAWIDDFDSGTLDSRWSWVRENPTYWSLTDNSGYLRLVTRGSLYQTFNDLENILLTPVSDTDYRIITRVTFSPTANIHKVGLNVYQDDDNYFQLVRVYVDGHKIRIRTELGGVTTTNFLTDETATTLYLRIDKFGNDYYGFYSIDGDAWEFIGHDNVILSNPYVDLFAGNGATTLEINADFDFFQYMPLSFDHSWEDDFSGSTLDSAWSWL